MTTTGGVEKAPAAHSQPLLAQPVMPASCATILDQLAVDAADRDFTAVSVRLEPGTVLPKPVPVFPRLEAPTQD